MLFLSAACHNHWAGRSDLEMFSAPFWRGHGTLGEGRLIRQKKKRERASTYRLLMKVFIHQRVDKIYLPVYIPCSG